MKRILLGVAFALTLGACADATVRVVESKNGAEPEGYVPAMLSNGRLNVFMDYRLAVAEESKALKRCHLTPGIFWEGRRLGDNDGTASRFGYSLLPQGAFCTRLVVDGQEQSAPTNWWQSLDLRRALMSTKGAYAGGVTLAGEAFVSKARNVIAVRQTIANTSREPRRVTFGLAYAAPRHERIRGAWRVEPGAAIWEMTCYGRFVTKETITVRGLGGDAPEAKAKVVDASGVVQHTVTLAPGASRVAEWFVAFDDDLAKKLPKVSPAPAPKTPLSTYAALRAEHVADWEAFAGESEIRVPEARIQEMFEMARYHLRCASTEWSIPVGVMQSHWSGRIFAFDEMYGAQGLIAAGHFAAARVAPDFRAATLTNACIRCNKNQGNPFNAYGARWVWEAAEGNDVECAPLGFWMDHIFQQAAVAQTVWTYYRYTGDRGYLAEKGYDVIRECALFFRRLQVQDMPDGTSFVAKCTDLERMGSGHERAFMTTCGVITTLRAAADAANLLGRDADLAKDFRACAERLVASLPERDGRYIAYPGCAEESMGTLAGFYPFRTFDRSNAKQMAAVAHFLENGQAFGNMYETGRRICPWYAATMAMASLRAGNEAHPPIRWLREAACSGGCWGEFWEINEPGVSEYRPWFMTAAGNVLYAICQLFVAEMEGGVQLGAGVPPDWTDYSFRLPAPGGFEVSLDVKGGAVAKFAVRPRQPNAPRPAFIFRGRRLQEASSR
ncbi:MAG: glycosyl hydrolase family 95 catalytic domain-containing protein [Kiritimatiellia bacterium]